MKKQLLIFVVLLVTLLIFSPLIKANLESSSNQNVVEELTNKGYGLKDIYQAESLAIKYSLSIETILQLKPDGYDWALVEVALEEMNKTKVKMADKNKRKEDRIIAALSKDFTDDEIMLVVYFSTIFNKDIENSLSEIIAEKQALIKEGKNNPLARIDLTPQEHVQLLSSTQPSRAASDQEQDIYKSSPFSTLMESHIDRINPFTGFLRTFDHSLILPGKNGLDLNLSLVFRSECANIDKIDVKYNHVTGRYDNDTYPRNELFNRHNLGVGWSFSFPFLDSNKCLHFDKQTYLVDWENKISGLKNVNTKEFVLRHAIVFNVLYTKNGICYFFNPQGQVFLITNRFGDAIQLGWQGQRLEKIVDSVGRVITFSYTDTLVTMTINSGSKPYQVKFHKEHISDGLYKLSKVEYPENVSISYEYTVALSEFNLLERYAPKNRRSLLLNKVINPFGGSITYNYSTRRRQLSSDCDKMFAEFHKIEGRYETLNGKKSNYTRYKYFYNEDGQAIKTSINYYEELGNTDPAKIMDLKFNDNGENYETTLTYDNQKEEKKFVYCNGMLESIDIIKTDQDGASITEEINYDYDDYGNIVYQKDISGKIYKADYITMDIGTHSLSCLKTSREQIDGNLFHGIEYEYDNYGNPLVASEQEIIMEVSDEIKYFPSQTMTESGQKYLKEMPEGTTKVSLKIFAKAYAICGNSDCEVRFWAKGESRPQSPYARYELQAALLGSHEHTKTLTINLPYPGQRYYVEVLATRTGAFGSYVSVQELKADYRDVVVSSIKPKVTTYNHYPTPSVSGLPSKVHQEYGNGGSTHRTDFGADGCIVKEYLYEHVGVDHPYGDENYSNLWPTKITQYYKDADEIQQSEVQNLRYNRFGQITQQTKGDIVKKYEYDDLKRLTKEISFGQVNGIKKELHQIYDYSSHPNIDGYYTTTISHQDKNGSGAAKYVTTVYYNQAGKPVKSTKGTGAAEIITEKIIYDGFGRKKSVEDGEGIKSIFYYDKVNRPTKIKQYDKNGVLVNYTQKTYDDIARKITEQMYEGSELIDQKISYMDKQGNLSKVEQYITSSSKATTHYEYNYAGQLTKTIDPRNIPLSYNYGYFGVEKIDYPGVIRADDVFEYDFIDSKRVVKKKRDNDFIETHLDELNREKKVIYSPTRKLRKYYNSSGLIKEANFSSINKINYDYDEKGQLIDVQHNYDGWNYSIGYTYDERGNCTSITYPNGLKVDYIYDNYGRVIKIPGYVNKIGGFAGVEYRDNGFIDSITYNNGIVTDYIPDSMFRISKIKSSVMSYYYQYDSKGNITDFKKYNPSTGDTLSDFRYTYYFTDWLDEEKNNLKVDHKYYTYDSAGNRICLSTLKRKPYTPKPPKPDPIIIDPPFDPRDSATIMDEVVIPGYDVIKFYYNYDSNDLNLLTKIDENTVTYDKWGNIKHRGDNGHNYTFNESNQLTQVTSGSTIVGQYWYNVEGKRYKKVENNKTTYYIYSGENLLYEERDDCTICYVYLNGKPVARVENGSLGQKTYYYHTDLQGTTRVITDSSGNVVVDYDYDAFGTPNTDISNESIAYTTKGQDVTGLYYFNARYYDPTLGRFISEDPAKDGPNWYIYCSNNPLKYVDPSGLDKIYYDQTGNEINRENYWWMFWDKHFVLGNDGKSFWPIQAALEPGEIEQVIENGNEIFDEFVQVNAPTSWWQKIFPFTVNEVLKNSPSKESWDIKRRFRNSIIILNGKGYREDMFGNITWGYLMAARGWPSGISKKGAGIYQNYSGTSSLKFWFYNMVNFGDDPRDSYAIDQGYNLFYRDLFGW